MARLTTQQIAQYAYQAGFRGQDLVNAVAIALKESNGDTQAYNPETAAGTKKGSGSRGLWQIYGAAHPEYNNDSVYDPAQNAAAAYAVYKAAGNKFTPWSTWNNGSAKSLSLSIGDLGAYTAAAEATVTGIGGAVAGAGQAAVNESITAALDSIGSRLLGKNADGKPRELGDAVAFGAGFTLIMLGLIFLFIKSGAGETTVKVIGSAVKAAA